MAKKQAHKKTSGKKPSGKTPSPAQQQSADTQPEAGADPQPQPRPNQTGSTEVLESIDEANARVSGEKAQSPEVTKNEAQLAKLTEDIAAKERELNELRKQRATLDGGLPPRAGTFSPFALP